MAREVWPKLELVVAVDQFFNNTLNYADIVLPAAHYYETEEIVLSGDVPYVLYRQKVIEPLWEARPDWEIYRGIASRLGLGQYFGSIEEECTKWLDMPLMRQQGIDYQRLKKEQAIRFLPKPYIPWQDGKFKTPTGRLEFYLEKKVPQGEELPVFKWPLEAGPDSPQAAKYPLILITRHEKFRIHSQYENQPWLREINPEPLVDLNPQEARKRGIGDGDLVEVFNDRGHALLLLALLGLDRSGWCRVDKSLFSTLGEVLVVLIAVDVFLYFLRSLPPALDGRDPRRSFAGHYGCPAKIRGRRFLFPG